MPIKKGVGTTVAGSELPAEPGTTVVDEIQQLVRASVSPYRSPTSQELRERLPKVARLLVEYSEECGLSDEEAASIFEIYVSRVLETQLRERLSEAMAHSSIGRTRHRVSVSRFGELALSR